ATCTIPSMNGNKTASVTFLQYLTVSPSPSNGSITGAGLNCPAGNLCQVTVPYGNAPTLSANPSQHYHLVSWGGDCPGSPCAPSMTANHTVTASFAIDQFTLTVTVVNSTGGTVTAVPGFTGCGTSCSATYNYGDKVTLRESPASLYVFGQWGGGCSGSNSAC